MFRFFHHSFVGIWLGALLVTPATFISAEHDGYLKAAGKPTGAGLFKDFLAKVTIVPAKTTELKYRMEPAELAKPSYGRLRFGGGVGESFGLRGRFAVAGFLCDSTGTDQYSSRR